VIIVNLTFNFKNKFERFTRNSLYKPSPLLELKIVYSEPTLKWLKYKRNKKVILLAFNICLLDSLKSFIKTFKDKSKKRKGYTHCKFIKRYLNKYINNKSRWFKTILKRYNDFSNLLI
jgi:DNA gyrase/topoisomerase IV subunit B